MINTESNEGFIPGSERSRSINDALAADQKAVVVGRSTEPRIINGRKGNAYTTDLYIVAPKEDTDPEEFMNGLLMRDDVNRSNAQFDMDEVTGRILPGQLTAFDVIHEGRLHTILDNTNPAEPKVATSFRTGQEFHVARVLVYPDVNAARQALAPRQEAVVLQG